VIGDTLKMTLDFEKEKFVKELKKRKPKRILVQLAEGIKQNAPDILNVVEKLGMDIEVIFSGETCWGACSVALQEAEALQVDLIVHFGHAEFIKMEFPTLYIEVKDKLNLTPILKKSLPALKKYKTIGLSYSVQHLSDMPGVKKFYEKNGKKVIFSKKQGYAAHEGHVVGCEFTGLKSIKKDVDALVILGNNFHSMGAALAVEKPVVLIDVYNDAVTDMVGVRDKILKQRAISIERLREAKNVGIIIDIKPGQKFGSPKFLVKKLKEQGKNVIMNFYSVDCFIELACPRIAIDDFAKYPRPIVTFKEALVALGVKTWDEMLELGFV
jgi:2-(3-amino-3-carboxypropyl)histidine synthase